MTLPGNSIRACIRLPIKLPIKMRGVKVGGEPFDEETSTISISKMGATVATANKPAVGSSIEITNKILDLTAKARVIWVGEDKFPKQVGVELLAPQDIWGVKFPPRDAPETLSSAMLGPEPEEEAPRISAKPAGGPLNPAPRTWTETGEPPCKPLLVENWPEPRGQRYTPEARPQAMDVEVPVELTDGGALAQAKVKEAPERAEEKGKELETLEQHLDSLRRCVRASQEELELLHLRFEKLQEAWKSEEDRTRTGMSGAIEELTQQATRNLNERLQNEAEAASQRAAAELRKQLEEEASDAIGNLSRQATNRLMALMQDSPSSATLKDDIEKQVSHVVQGALENLARKTQETAQAYERQLESTLQEFQRKSAQLASSADSGLDEAERRIAAEHARKLQEVSSVTLGELQQQAKAVLSGAQSEWETSLLESQEVGIEELRGHLRNSAEETLEFSTKQLQKYTEDSLVMLREEHKASNAALRDDIEKQASHLVQGVLENLARKTQETAQECETQLESTLQEFQRKSTQLASSAGSGLDEAERRIAAEHARKLQEISNAIVGELQQQAKAVLNGAQSEWETSLRKSQEVGIEEVRGHLRKCAEEILETSTKQLQKHSEDSLMLREELKASSAALRDDLEKQAPHVVQETLENLARKTQETAQAYESQLENTLQEFQRKSAQQASLAGSGLDEAERRIAAEHAKKLQEVSSATLEELQQQAKAVLSGAQSEWETSLLKSQEMGIEEVRGHLRKSAEEILESSAKQLQQHSEDSLVMLREELKASSAALRDDIEKQVSHVVQGALENLARKTQETAQAYESQLENTLQEFQRKSAQLASSAGSELDEAERKIAADHTTKLQQVSNATLGELQQQARAVLNGAQSEWKTSLLKSQEMGIEEVRGHLRKSAEEILESSTRQLQKHSEDSLVKLREELKASGAALRDDIEKQAPHVVQETLENLARKTQETAQVYESQLENTLQEFQRKSARLASSAGSGLDEAERKIGDLGRAVIASLSEKTQEAERSRVQLIIAASTEMEKSAQLVIAQTKSACEQATQAASAEVFQHIGEGVLALKDWTDQAKFRLEACFRPSLESFRNQIADISASATAEHEREVERFVASLHDTLEEAARLFLSKKAS